MKKYIIVLFCLIITNIQAQNYNDAQHRILFQSCYSIGNEGNEYHYGMNDGFQLKLSSDWRITTTKKWFAGVGLNYLRSSFDHLTSNTIGFDIYSLTCRSGWESLIVNNVVLRGVIECGPAYMQSRHQYDGTRYRTSNPTVMMGIEVGAEYIIKKNLGLNISCGISRYGNDNLQHGSSSSSLHLPLLACPFIVSVGISYAL